MSKSIDTLVDDIYELVGSDSLTLDDKLLEALGTDLQSLMRNRFERPQAGPHLRLSAVGKPARQLYYDINHHGLIESKEELQPNVLLKFMFGDIWELLLLWLAKQSGHEVTHEQAEVTLKGVVGHNDAIIDGVVVDVKSASSYAFRKFADGTLPDDDPFGYMEQLAAYCTAHGGLDGAFLAVDKQLGKLALLRFSYEELKQYAIEERIDYLKEVLASPELPERCYSPEPDGKSGNMKLGVNCSYCPFKQECWSDANGGVGLRTFLYSNGPRHFTEVVKEPNVLEITI